MSPTPISRQLLPLSIGFLMLLVACTPAAAPTPAPAPAKPTEPAKAAPATPASAATPTAAPKAEATAAPKSKPETSAPKTLIKMKAGMNLSASNTPFFIGIEKGYYKEQGFDVELINMGSGNETVPPLSTGEILIGVGAIGAGVFNAVLRDIPIKMVAASNVALPGLDSSGWLVRKDLYDSGQIREIKDLKGHSIGLSGLATGAEVTTDFLLAAGGLTPKDVTYISINQPDMLPALANKAVDVVRTPEPHLTNAEENKVAVVWKMTSDILSPYQMGGVNMSPHLWKQNPEAAKAFVLAHVKAMRDYVDAFGPKRKDREAVLKMQAKYTSVKDLAVLDKMRPTGINPDGFSYVDAIAKDLEWYISKGLVKPMKVTDLVDNSYAEYAVSVLGKYQP